MTDRFAGTDTTDCQNLRSYCGGNYRGIIDKLDYIVDMGFSAIWLSPISQNLEVHNAYHGYWTSDWTRLNHHFGSVDDLKDLVRECHKRDILVMIDVIAGYVAPVDLDFSQMVPFNHPDHYHPKCHVKNWENQTEMEWCRLYNLPDLSQENEFVKNFLLRWIRNTIDTFHLDGLRIDTVPYVPKYFWKEWKKVVSDETFTMGEVFDWRVEYLAQYSRILGSALSFPMFFTIRNGYASGGSLAEISRVRAQYWKHIDDPAQLGTFVDNHDIPRQLNVTSDLTLYENSLMYVLMGEGIPIVYYGTEQHLHGGQDPTNREPLWFSEYRRDGRIYQHLKKILHFRNAHIDVIANAPQIELAVSDKWYVFSRGDAALIITSSFGSNASEMINIGSVEKHPFEAGQGLCNVLDREECINVEDDGTLHLHIRRGRSALFAPIEVYG